MFSVFQADPLMMGNGFDNAHDNAFGGSSGNAGN